MFPARCRPRWYSVVEDMKYFSFGDAWAAVNSPWKNEVSIFELEFAQYLGAKFAVGTSFGRTALCAGLKAAGVEGKEVIVPAFTCTVVRHAIVMAGATPRFVDIDLITLEMDLKDLRRKICSKTKAIIFIHYFGRVGRRLEETIEIAREKGLLFIEDCAHSLGAECRGRKIGSFGDFSIFSLTKNTVNCGGGVLVTDDRELHDRVREIVELEKVSGVRRWVDFPIMLAYGLEQGIDKVVLDRPRGGSLKWRLTKLPPLVLLLRRLALSPRKWSSSGRSDQKEGEGRGGAVKNTGKGRYPEGIQMEPIIASLGRSQLRKLDYLNEARRAVYEELRGVRHNHFRNSRDFQGRDVHTHLVLRFQDDDIFQVIEKCRKQGVSLKPTWPTHQRLWAEQDTQAVRGIGKEFVTYCINPKLTSLEIRRLVEAVDRF